MQIINSEKSIFVHETSVTDPAFPGNRCANPLFGKNVDENCMKMKEIDRAFLAPPGRGKSFSDVGLL